MTTRARDHTEAVGMVTLVAVGEGSVVGEGSTLAGVVVEVLEEVTVMTVPGRRSPSPSTVRKWAES